MKPKNATTSEEREVNRLWLWVNDINPGCRRSQRSILASSVCADLDEPPKAWKNAIYIALLKTYLKLFLSCRTIKSFQRNPLSTHYEKGGKVVLKWMTTIICRLQTDKATRDNVSKIEIAFERWREYNFGIHACSMDYRKVFNIVSMCICGTLCETMGFQNI